MNDTVKIKGLIFPFIFSVCILIFIFFRDFSTQQAKSIFCNVGQGDAIYLRTQKGTDILVDSGPDQRVLSCLGKYMPVYDKTIEYVFLTHPQTDHYSGLFKIIEHYKVKGVYLTVKNYQDDSQFLKLTKILKNKNIPLFYVSRGDVLQIDQFASLSVLWPEKNFTLKTNISNKKIDINNFSLVAVFQENNFRLLLTGDISASILERLLQKSNKNYNILKIPHHGSKYGLNQKILQLAEPDAVVISVGKSNLYGHPAKEIINLLQALKIKIKRTDSDGDIVFLGK